MTTDPQRESWAHRPLPEVIDFILETYHRPLLPELQRLGELAQQADQPEVLQVFDELRGELEQHLQKEERVLFPWLRSGRGASAGAPVRVMLMEHESTKGWLRELRALIGRYQVSGAEETPLAQLCQGLVRLERDLLDHIRLEEEVLFPRGLGLD